MILHSLIFSDCILTLAPVYSVIANDFGSRSEVRTFCIQMPGRVSLASLDWNYSRIPASSAWNFSLSSASSAWNYSLSPASSAWNYSLSPALSAWDYSLSPALSAWNYSLSQLHQPGTILSQLHPSGDNP